MVTKNTANLNSEADTNIATNTAGDISATDVRTLTKNLADSFLNLLDGDVGAEGTVASAATTDIGAVESLRIQVTGTTIITSLGTGANKIRLLRFAGVLTLTHNATSLIIPGGVNRLTAANDLALFTSDATGNWRMAGYIYAADYLGAVSVWTKPQRKNVVSVTPTATVFSPDWNLANDFDLGTLAANSTMDGGSNGPVANSAQAGEITVNLNGFTFGLNATAWDFPDAAEPAMSGKVTLYYRLWHDGTTLQKRITGIKAWG